LKPNKIVSFNIFLLLLFAVSQLFAQTKQWRLIWDKNKESDMDHYIIFRSEQSPAKDVLTNITHTPIQGDDTLMIYTDKSLNRGIRYFYRLKAVDSSGLESDFSDEVSAAIPLIQNSFPHELWLISDTTYSFNYHNYIQVPGYSDNQITATDSGKVSLQITINDQTGMIHISTPTPFLHDEHIQFTVMNSDSFYDVVQMTVHAVTTGPKIDSDNFNSFSFYEDNSLIIENLNQYVNDRDTQPQDLIWQVTGSQHIHGQVDNIHKRATLHADPDWYGTEKVKFLVKDLQDGADSAWVDIHVRPVNDPPRISALPNLDLSLTRSAILDLNNYVTDIDDDISGLHWQYAGNDSVQITISSQNRATFQVSEDWYGRETIRFIVRDDSAARDTASLVVFSQDPHKAPVLNLVNTVSLDEDHTATIRFNSPGDVSDPDNSVTDLTWEISQPNHIQRTFDKQALQLQITPDPNWNGQEDIYLKVEDPDNNVAFDTITVVVNPVNDPPVLEPIGDIVFLANSIYIMNLKDYIRDADGLSDISSVELLAGGNSPIGYFIDINNFEITFFSPPVPLAEETYLLRVTDSGGLQASTSFRVRVLEDNLQSPVIVRSFGNSTNKLLNWSTNLQTRDVIKYGLDTDYGQQKAVDEQYVTEHKVLLENLESNQLYHFQIVSTDSNGIIFTTTDSTFETGSLSKEINVFPIPYRVYHPEDGPGVYFSNLPVSSQLLIYNLQGELVFRKINLNHIFLWTVINNADRAVHTGVYMYVVRDKNNKKISSGKLIIIR